MDEIEIPIYYPPDWEDEYKRNRAIAIWSEEFPEMFDGSCGTHKPPYARTGTLENFPNYALMYLLRKNHGVYSITYFRLGSKASKDGNRLQVIMRKWMGDAAFEKLRSAIQADPKLWGFKGEPDLFCWHPETRVWFFAEAKGKDRLLESQHKWFRICRDTIPGVDIRVYRVCLHVTQPRA